MSQTLNTRQWLEMAPPDAREAFKELIQEGNKAKQRIINQLVANVNDPKTKVKLKNKFSSMTMNELKEHLAMLPDPRALPLFNHEQLAGNQGAPTNNAAIEPSWLGSAVPAGFGAQDYFVDNRAAEEDALPAPTLDLVDNASADLLRVLGKGRNGERR